MSSMSLPARCASSASVKHFLAVAKVNKQAITTMCHLLQRLHNLKHPQISVRKCK